MDFQCTLSSYIRNSLIISSVTLWASFRVEGVAMFYQDGILPSAAKLSTSSHHLLIQVDTQVMGSSSGFSLLTDMSRN
jgi:hypothetical protein